jgi:hypothetical protein
MAFIRNTDKFVEGLSNKFFTDGRAQLALQETVTSLEGEDSGMKLRLDVIEGGAGVEGSIAKAQADAQSYADQQIAALVNSAPEVLDTLKELSDAIGGDASFASTVAGQIGAVDAKVDQEVIDRAAAISALESSLGADVSDLESADSSLSLRLDELELDPVTKSYVDSQDSAEQSARQSADSALSGRLDTLEADPTTKTYVDSQDSGLQSQINTEKGRIDAILLSADADKDSFAEIVQLINSVDTTNDQAFAGYVASNDAALAQEVSDRQSGDSALSGRLDVLEADPTTKTYVDGQISSEASARSAEDATMFKKDGSRNLEGNFLFSNETFNIGSSSANRPNNVYVKTSVKVGNHLITDQVGGIGFNNVFINGGQRTKFLARSSSYSVTLNDYIIGMTSVTGSPVITLPTSNLFSGVTCIVKDLTGQASETNYIEIAPQGGKLIDGQSSYKITVPYESVTIISDGTNWFII